MMIEKKKKGIVVKEIKVSIMMEIGKIDKETEITARRGMTEIKKDIEMTKLMKTEEEVLKGIKVIAMIHLKANQIIKE